MDIFEAMRKIYESDIKVSIASRAEGGFNVKLFLDTEPDGLVPASVNTFDEAVRWLHSQILVSLPDSKYALNASRRGIDRFVPDRSADRALHADATADASTQ